MKYDSPWRWWPQKRDLTIYGQQDGRRNTMFRAEQLDNERTVSPESRAEKFRTFPFFTNLSRMPDSSPYSILPSCYESDRHDVGLIMAVPRNFHGKIRTKHALTGFDPISDALELSSRSSNSHNSRRSPTPFAAPGTELEWWPLRGRQSPSRSYTFGHSKRNEVIIARVHRLSETHCRVYMNDNGCWMLEDLSANGSTLNGDGVASEKMRKNWMHQAEATLGKLKCNTALALHPNMENKIALSSVEFSLFVYCDPRKYLIRLLSRQLQSAASSAPRAMQSDLPDIMSTAASSTTTMPVVSGLQAFSRGVQLESPYHILVDRPAPCECKCHPCDNKLVIHRQKGFLAVATLHGTEKENRSHVEEARDRFKKLQDSLGSEHESIAALFESSYGGPDHTFISVHQSYPQATSLCSWQSNEELFEQGEVEFLYCQIMDYMIPPFLVTQLSIAS